MYRLFMKTMFTVLEELAEQKNEGKAITFANELEMFHVAKIEALIKERIPRKKFPADVKIEKTDFAEEQEIARSLDDLKRKADPDFKGAFHEKKKIYAETKRKTSAKHEKRRGRKKH